MISRACHPSINFTSFTSFFRRAGIAIVGIGLLLHISSHRAAAQTIPAEIDYHSGQTVRNSSEAHGTWRHQSEVCRSLIIECLQIEAQLDQLTPVQYQKLKNELAAMLVERDRDMEEFRKGERCKACGRTRSQLIRDGVDPDEEFRKYGLNKPTIEEILARQRGWDTRLLAKQREIAIFDDRRHRLEWQRQLKGGEISERGGVWLRAINADNYFHVKEWDQDRAGYEAKIAQARKNMADATTAYEKAQRTTGTEKAVVEALKAGIDGFRSQITLIQRDLVGARARHYFIQQEFYKEVERDRDELFASASRLQNRYFMAGSVIANAFNKRFYHFALSYVPGMAPDVTTLGGFSAGGIGGSGGAPTGDAKSVLEGTTSTRKQPTSTPSTPAPTGTGTGASTTGTARDILEGPGKGPVKP